MRMKLVHSSRHEDAREVFLQYTYCRRDRSSSYFCVTSLVALQYALPLQTFRFTYCSLPEISNGDQDTEKKLTSWPSSGTRVCGTGRVACRVADVLEYVKCKPGDFDLAGRGRRCAEVSASSLHSFFTTLTWITIITTTWGVKQTMISGSSA